MLYLMCDLIYRIKYVILYILRESDDVESSCTGVRARASSTRLRYRRHRAPTGKTREDDLDVGAVEELLFGW